MYKCIFDGALNTQKEEIEDYFFISLDKLKEMIKKEPEKFPPNRIKIIKTYFENENFQI